MSVYVPPRYEPRLILAREPQGLPHVGQFLQALYVPVHAVSSGSKVPRLRLVMTW